MYTHLTNTYFQNFHNSDSLKRTLLLALISASSIVITNCSSLFTSSKKEMAAYCTAVDWYEIGRQDAEIGQKQGAPKRTYSKCTTHLTAEQKDLYANGWNNGLLDYCSPQNALELGRMNQRLELICPEHFAQNFNKAFSTGQHIALLEQRKTNIHRRIEAIFEELVISRTSTETRKQLENELDNLKRERAQLENRIDDLEMNVLRQ